MKCLFTDILTASPPGISPLDPGLSLIPGTQQMLVTLEQGIVLSQGLQIDHFEIVLLQAVIKSNISFEIRHPVTSDCYFFALSGKTEINTFHNQNIFLRTGNGHQFTNTAIQGFCTFRINKLNPSLLIVSSRPTAATGSLSFSFSPSIQEELERIVFNAYTSVKHFHITQIENLLRLADLEAAASKPAVHFGEKDLEGIHQVKTLIDESPEKSFTLLALSQKAAINMRKLNIGFKNLYGNTIFEYLLEKRMAIAQDKIITTDASLKIISKAAGYRSYANFSTAFKAHFGYAPSDLRKQKSP